MRSPAIRRRRLSQPGERGVTIILVALSMVGVLAMAVLSIDVITLYLDRLEAQRSADAAALTAARIISLSGITGDPDNGTGYWSQICGGETSAASQAAQAVAFQNTVAGIPATSVKVTYSAGAGSADSSEDCTARRIPGGFGNNPMVTVQVQRTALPTLFARMWGSRSSSVTVTATAEAFNPSDSGTVGNTDTDSITPVQPRCVKPWVVPNRDPLNGGTQFVSVGRGRIQNPGISLNGAGSPGVIGENFWLNPDCVAGVFPCTLGTNPPLWNLTATTPPYIEGPNNLQYVPAAIGTTFTAVPSCTEGVAFEKAIEGCESPTNYQCGARDANTIDLSELPTLAADTTNGVLCLIHQGAAPGGQPTGQDQLTPYAQPSSYPFQIVAGTNNPFITSGTAITSSASVASLPIYDDTEGTGKINSTGTTNVTFVGFLQVFINGVDQYGNINVTVLNVAGCGNGSDTTGSPVTGSSPVPVRLITPP